MNFLSSDNNILDLILWRKNKTSKSQISTQESQSLIAYYKSLSFEQLMSETTVVSKDLETGTCNLKKLKDALLLLSELEARIEADNVQLSLQVKSLINDLDKRMENIKS